MHQPDGMSCNLDPASVKRSRVRADEAMRLYRQVEISRLRFGKFLVEVERTGSWREDGYDSFHSFIDAESQRCMDDPRTWMELYRVWEATKGPELPELDPDPVIAPAPPRAPTCGKQVELFPSADDAEPTSASAFDGFNRAQ